MEKYDYRRKITDNIKDWILENGIIRQALKDELSIGELGENLSDELWDKDCITGNGPYGFAREDLCQEYVGTNLGLYFEAANEFDDWPSRDTPWIHRNPAQHMDATIRCYLLYECIDKALEELDYENVSRGTV